MNQRNWISLGVILVLVALGIWINLPNNPGIQLGSINRSLETRLGLDLRGGLQVLMEADLPAETVIAPEEMEVARQIMESRTNALGVEENTFQTAGARRLVGEFPGATNVEEVLATIRQTGLLEFVDFGTTPLPAGTVIQTDYLQGSTPSESPTPAEGTDPAAPATVYHTVMTGADLQAPISVGLDQLNNYYVSFNLTSQGKTIFGEYTSANVNRYLGIVLDKTVVSAPVIETPITQGEGSINGRFTSDEANALAVQLRYGSLPIPLKVVESRIIGPTLGVDSLNKSLVAGAVGLSIILLFMLLYYRVPGGVANLAILIYALLTLSLFKIIPVTLTLPGIAGLMLSTGSALDANILIFERLKEELRAGRTLGQALPVAWRRAWPSIRDSNIATLITCAILFWFGSTFGASIVKGFAVTLMLGVAVSLFTAFVVTRTFLTLLLNSVKITNLQKWFGI